MPCPDVYVKSNGTSSVVTFEKLERYLSEFRLELNLEVVSRSTNVLVEPATLDSIFEGRSIDIKLAPRWEPPPG